MKDISFSPENFRFLEVKFSIYLNRRVFVMQRVPYNKLGRQWSFREDGHSAYTVVNILIDTDKI